MYIYKVSDLAQAENKRELAFDFAKGLLIKNVVKKDIT